MYGSMFTIVYMHSAYYHCILLVYLALLGGGTEGIGFFCAGIPLLYAISKCSISEVPCLLQYMCTVYIIIVYDWFTLLFQEGEQEELVFFVQAFFCHNHNCMTFQNVLHLRLCVYYSIYICIVYVMIINDLFTLLCYEGEQEELVSFVQAFLCHNHNCMTFQNVLHLRFHVYYSIYVQCISLLYMTGLPCFLRRGNSKNQFLLCRHSFTIIV